MDIARIETIRGCPLPEELIETAYKFINKREEYQEVFNQLMRAEEGELKDSLRRDEKVLDKECCKLRAKLGILAPDPCGTRDCYDLNKKKTMCSSWEWREVKGERIKWCTMMNMPAMAASGRERHLII